jgi:threonine dehydratase
LRVFVPDWAPAAVLTTIESLGAGVVVCPRRDDDPPGDPALLRFREAVAAGALPFTVQGPENALCLDAGRTLGWEIAEAAGSPDGPERLDRVVVQVGGGALATCVGWALGPDVRLDTLQAQGCAPLARAWWRAKDAGYELGQLARRWSELMTPWDRPSSVADGILDDETYDWLGVVDVMAASGGRPIVVPEEAVVAAARLGAGTGIGVSATGSAGLAALLVDDGRSGTDEVVAVVFSGVKR